MVVSSFSLFFFGKGSNQFLPLLIIVVSLISFEVVNLFYNLSLHKVSNKNEEGLISNLGWGFGYLGGLISFLIVFSFIQLTKHYEYQILGISVFFIGRAVCGHLDTYFWLYASQRFYKNCI